MTRAIAKLSLRSRLTIKATEPRGPAIERVGREYRLWLDAIWGRTQSCLIKQPVTSDTVCKNFATLNLYEFAAWPRREKLSPPQSRLCGPSQRQTLGKRTPLPRNSETGRRRCLQSFRTT